MSLALRSSPALPYQSHAKLQRDDGMYSRIKYKPPFRPYTTFRSASIEFHCQLRIWAQLMMGNKSLLVRSPFGARLLVS